MNKTKSVITMIILALLIVCLTAFTFMPVKIQLGNYDYCSPINQLLYSMDLVEGNYVSFKVDGANDSDKLEETISILQNRLKLIQERLGVEGISDSVVSVNNDILNIQLPQDDQITYSTLFAIIGAQGELVISLSEDGSNPFIPYDEEGNELSWAQCIKSCVAIVDSTATSNPYGISLEVNEYGLEALKEGTKDVTSQSNIYFILDGQVIGQPTISSQITMATSQITGYPSVQSAQTLAIQFVSGQYPLNITNTNNYFTTDSVLGAQALKALFIAVMAIVLFTIIFFVVKNGAIGWATTLALMVYMVLAAFAIVYLPFGQTVPLMAIVGFVVGLVVFALINFFYAYVVRRQFSSSDKKSYQTAMDEAFKYVLKLVIDVCVVIFIVSVIVAIIAVGALRNMALMVAICDVICVLVTLLITKGFIKLVGNMTENKNKFKLSEEVE